jgi:predicted phosphodiesterase
MIGILSDAHGNQPAFELAINQLKSFGANRFIFLGDALGYLPTPAVLDSINNLGNDIQCIRGNHENMMLKCDDNSENEPIYQHAATKRLMNKGHIATIQNWATELFMNFPSGNSIFLHGSPLNPIYGYVYPDTDLAQFHVEEKFVFLGHTHHPFIKKISGTTFVNTGSCGLPRDHGTLGSAVLFDEYTGAVRLIRFNIRKSIEQALAMVESVNSSVLKLFRRKSKNYEGELIIT